MRPEMYSQQVAQNQSVPLAYEQQNLGLGSHGNAPYGNLHSITPINNQHINQSATSPRFFGTMHSTGAVVALGGLSAAAYMFLDKPYKKYAMCGMMLTLGVAAGGILQAR